MGSTRITRIVIENGTTIMVRIGTGGAVRVTGPGRQPDIVQMGEDAFQNLKMGLAKVGVTKGMTVAIIAYRLGIRVSPDQHNELGVTESVIRAHLKTMGLIPDPAPCS